MFDALNHCATATNVSLSSLAGGYLLRILNHVMKPVEIKFKNVVSKVTEIEKDNEIRITKITVISDELKEKVEVINKQTTDKKNRVIATNLL